MADLRSFSMPHLLDVLAALARSTRRTLLGRAVGGAAVLASSGRLARAAETKPGSILLDAFAPLEAATARIIPSSNGPGAREAQVMRFIERQLSGEMAPLLASMRTGGQVLDRIAEARHKKEFAMLEPVDQDRILGELSKGELPLKGFPQKEWFLVLHNLTLEGFLSDPVHGGNSDQIGWRAIDFPEPHLRAKGGAKHGSHLPVVH